MKPTIVCLAMSAVLLVSCATYGPYEVSSSHPYGAPLTYFYGEGIHAGVDFTVSKGTPVIAASDGVVVSVAKAQYDLPNSGGLFVRVAHGEHFDSEYAHLSEVPVKVGQSIKRGQLIGLSGNINSGHQYLHFGICKKRGNCSFFSQTHNPQDYWLDGKPHCFDPAGDYSRRSQTELTAPLACGEHAKLLLAQHNKK